MRGTRVDRGASIELSTQPGRNCIFVAAIQLAEMDMLHWQMWECLPDTFHPMLTSTQPALLVWARPLDEPSAAAELHIVVSLNLWCKQPYNLSTIQQPLLSSLLHCRRTLRRRT